MIADFQNAFVRILADENFRGEFFTNPKAALKNFGLSVAECNALTAIPRADLDRYASSLLSKRTDEFSRALPWTRKICPSIKDRYRQWLKTHPSPKHAHTLDPGLAEALRAFPDLVQEIASDPAEASYAADLFAFEVYSKCASQDGQTRFLRLRYRTDLLIQEIRSGCIPMDPEVFPVLFRFDHNQIRWKKL